MPHTAYIVDACRTAAGRRNGRLSKWHPQDLGATVCDALITRNKIDANAVDDVIFGCVSQIGAQAANIGRMVVLASKQLPETCPGVSVDRQCGSSQQALHFAAQAVMSGVQDVVIAGGVEVMSLIPIGSNVIDGAKAGRGSINSPGVKAKYNHNDGIFSQFEGAELLAQNYNITREEMDSLATRSHRLAAEATKKGHFKREIVPLQGHDKDGNPVDHSFDEGIRPGTSMESLGKLKTLAGEKGRITAGTASQISDGASAVLVCNEAGLKKLGLRPRAKIISLALAGSDPIVMLGGPIPATEAALKKISMSIDDVDLYEVNEAFASVPLSWAKALNAKIDRLNVNGGAMALGHPLGATGTKLMCSLVHELERSGKRYGLLAICEGGGTANATIIECLPAPSKL